MAMNFYPKDFSWICLPGDITFLKLKYWRKYREYTRNVRK
jgi:hypothetical protein